MKYKEYLFTYGDLSGNFFVKSGANVLHTLTDLLIENNEIDKFLDEDLLTNLEEYLDGSN